MTGPFDLPVFADVEAAAKQISGLAVRTPLLKNATLDEVIGGDVWIKPECLQRTGSFKFRGAFNALSRLSDDQMERGVVAFSSGNHAQGVAEAARLLGIDAQIVMPSDAPEIKKQGVISRGSTIVPFDRLTEDREALCRQISEETGRVIIPSYDHRDIMAGQGTTGLEVIQQLSESGDTADQIICCVGGGGHIAGIGLAFEALSPDTQVWGAEPDGFDDHARSLKAGERLSNKSLGGSISDALMASIPGEMTFELNRRQMTGVGVVSDDETREAMRFAFKTLKLVVEPGGIVSLAALLSGKIKGEGRTTVVVLTGGNVDPALYAGIISE